MDEPRTDQGPSSSGRGGARITTIGVPPNTPEESVIELIEAAAAERPDLILLPEVWISQASRPPGSVANPVVGRVRDIAKRHGVNIIYPLDHEQDGKRRNSALFVSRSGSISATYDKIYPYWAELTLERPVDPGERVAVVQTDFGRLGMAICFDVNFPEVWQTLADREVDMVAWISAYSAGSSLAAHALNHNFYIVTATQHPDASVIDITGKEICYEQKDSAFLARFTIDLDRCIFHENFNMLKVRRLLEEHPDEVQIEQRLHREQWFVLRATKPGVSARALAAEYGLEELRHYKSRSRREIDDIRGRGVVG